MARQDVLMEPQSPGSPASPDKPPAPELPEPYAEMRSLDEDAAVKPDRRTSSSSSSSSRASSTGCVFHVDVSEMRTPLVAAAADSGDDGHADAGPGPAAESKLPDDWVSWPEPSPDGGTVPAAPEAQTMAKPAVEGFNPDRIPASVFQPKVGSQADWSITSNESLFSIHGASLSISDDLHAPSRSHFDYFYDEAMAAGGGGFADGKLPPLAEVPGSAMSDATEGSSAAKRAIRRHESGSIGSSSNFSFAFPILAEPSPGTRESMGGYQQLQKEHDPSPPTPSNRKSQFEEMTTEEERRQRPNTGWCWCGECCGCCWFACTWPTCCCQWRWRCCCSCSCSWPTCCQCSWCL